MIHGQALAPRSQAVKVLKDDYFQITVIFQVVYAYA